MRRDILIGNEMAFAKLYEWLQKNPGGLKIVPLNFAKYVFTMDNVQIDIANFFMFARHIVSSVVGKLYSFLITSMQKDGVKRYLTIFNNTFCIGRISTVIWL